MEIMFSWFWIFNLFKLIIIVGFAYFIIKYTESKKPIDVILAGFLFVMIMVFSSIKINSTDSKNFNNLQNNAIESIKTIPEKIRDDSFKIESNKDIRIKKSDLK